MMGFRAAPILRGAIVRWAENQPDQPTLSEATRRLVEHGLGKFAPTAATSAHKSEPAVKAKHLATKTIEKLVDPNASTEEQASRKRKLLKGPAEFRDVRRR